MAIFSTITGAIEKGGQAVGISPRAIASGFGLVDGTQKASNYDTPLRSTVISPENIQAQVDAQKEAIKQNQQKGTIIYPPDLQQRYVKFTFYQYERPSALVQFKKHKREVIVLPVPTHNIAETYDPEIQGQALNLMGSILDDTNDLSELQQQALGTGLRAAGVASVDIISRKIGKGAGQVTSSLIDYGMQLNGITPNPHPSFFFKGVNMRSHRYNWNLAPRNFEESNIVKTVVHTFKKHMLPFYKFGSSFLTYPSMCSIEFQPNEYAPEMKMCFVDSLHAEYSPQTFANTNGAPAFTNLRITFQEIEALVNSDSLKNEIDKFGDDQ